MTVFTLNRFLVLLKSGKKYVNGIVLNPAIKQSLKPLIAP